MIYFLVAIYSYLLGSIPVGFLIAKTQGVDLRTCGSGSTGATNVVRVLGKKWGYLCFLADLLKGWAAVFLTHFLNYPHPLAANCALVLAGVCAIVGHNFPCWLKFQGGKGVATSAGVMLGLFPFLVVSIGFATWLILFFSTRIVSISSLLASLTLSLFLLAQWKWGQVATPQMFMGAIMTLLIFWQHRSNVRRLFQGTEPRFDKSSKRL